MTERRWNWYDWSWRFALHVVTGLVCVAVHYGIMALLLSAGIGPVLSSGLGFVAGAITRFVTAYYKVFAPGSTVVRTLPRFIMALAAQGLLNSLLLLLLLEVGLPVWYAQVGATGLMTVLNYLVYRLWVFR
jgi:putative flippase GtrA